MDQIIVWTSTKTQEDAFIALTRSKEEMKLLAWREKKDADA